MPCWGKWGIGWCQQRAAYIPVQGRETNRDALGAPGRGNRRRVRRLPDGQVREKNSPALGGRAVRLSRPIAAELPGRSWRFFEEPRREEIRQRRQKRCGAGQEPGYRRANLGKRLKEAAQLWFQEARLARRARVDGGLSRGS